MPTSLRIELTEELCRFIHENSGDGTLFVTPGEFVRAVLSEKWERMETTRIREAIMDGLQDAIDGRIVEYQRDLRKLLPSFKE